MNELLVYNPSLFDAANTVLIMYTKTTKSLYKFYINYKVYFIGYSGFFEVKVFQIQLEGKKCQVTWSYNSYQKCIIFYWLKRFLLGANIAW